MSVSFTGLRRPEANASTNVSGRALPASPAPGNSTALVGTGEQSPKRCSTVTISAFPHFIRGFDPLEDAIQYGGELIPTAATKWTGLRPGKGGLVTPWALSSPI